MLPSLGTDITRAYCHKWCYLKRGRPPPPRADGEVRPRPDGRHGDVVRRSNDFCRHVRHPSSSHSRRDHSPARRGGLGISYNVRSILMRFDGYGTCPLSLTAPQVPHNEVCYLGSPLSTAGGRSLSGWLFSCGRVVQLSERREARRLWAERPSDGSLSESPISPRQWCRFAQVLKRHGKLKVLCRHAVRAATLATRATTRHSHTGMFPRAQARACHTAHTDVRAG